MRFFLVCILSVIWFLRSVVLVSDMFVFCGVMVVGGLRILVVLMVCFLILRRLIVFYFWRMLLYDLCCMVC